MTRPEAGISRFSFRALLACLAAVVLLGWIATRMSGSRPYRSVLDERHLAMRALARSILAETNVSTVLIIGNPFARGAGAANDLRRYDEASVEGFRAGAGSKVIVELDYPKLRPEAEANPAAVRIPPTTTPLSFLVAEDAFQLLADQHPRARLVVSLVGIPTGLTRLPLWSSPEGPRLALLLPDWRVLGDANAVRKAFASGRIAGAVVRRTGAPPESQPLSRDPEADLRARFLIVTPNNAAEMMARHPELF